MEGLLAEFATSTLAASWLPPDVSRRNDCAVTCIARPFGMASNHSYREIRPASECDPGARPQSQSPSPAAPSQSSRPATSPQKPVRRNVWVACESCKKRKTKCTADRPKCTSCATRGLDCHYNADPSESRSASLKRKHDDLERQNGCLKQFFAALRSLPEAQAYEVLRRIRSGASAEDIVRQIEGGCLLLQLSERPGDGPPSCDIPSITAMPAFLLTPQNSFVDSDLSQETSLDSRESSASQPQTADEDAGRLTSTSETRQSSQGPPKAQSIASLLL